jgi:prevent-host-death family protein
MTRRRQVGARELKTRLGTYLRQVRRGATLIVTERGEPVAELRPIPTGEGDVERRLHELAALGVLAREKSGPLPPFAAIPGGRGGSLSDAIREDREDRF